MLAAAVSLPVLVGCSAVPVRDNALVLDEPLDSAEGIRTASCDFWGT